MLVQLIVSLQRQTKEVKQLNTIKYGVNHHYRNCSDYVFQRCQRRERPLSV